MKRYNENINQAGTSTDPRIAIDETPPYFEAVVEDVVVNEEDYLKVPEEVKTKNGQVVGFALLRLLPGQINVPVGQLKWIPPMDTAIREYPLVDEIVLVFASQFGMFYTRRLNVTNKITESRVVGIKEAYGGTSTLPTSENVALASRGGVPIDTAIDPVNTVNNKSKILENPLAKMIRHTPGDVVIQGRFGNSIRLGSSLFSKPLEIIPEPNLLFRVGPTSLSKISTEKVTDHSLVFEDINLDKSSIWMLSNEEVKLNVATKNTNIHLRSAESSDSSNYTGAQIFINSGRVIVNSKENEISLFSNKEINLNSVESITLDSGKLVMMYASRGITATTPENIVLSGSNVAINSGNTLTQISSKSNIILGEKIFIGTTGVETQPVVLGGELVVWLRSLLSALSIELVQSFSTLNPAPFGNKLIQLQADLGVPSQPTTAKLNSNHIFVSKTPT
jgi:hypothetical protein